MPQSNPRALTIGGHPEPIVTGTLHPHWAEAARAKGFTLIARVRDRYSLALRCNDCGTLVCKALYVLMTCQKPLCPHCIEAGWRAKARAAGLSYLRRDPGNTHYAHYQAPCGHQIRRQFELIERIARGAVKHRCETCLSAREQGEAAARGWDLIGPDPKGDTNYRLYRHADCGARARIARANMRTGRFTCPGCGESWATAPSHLYAMRFQIAPGRYAVKLGFSRDPGSRLDHQLPRDKGVPRKLLYSVPIPSGQLALRLEKQLHKRLQSEHPGGLLPPEAFATALKVKSEVYRPELQRPILRELRRIARNQIGAARRPSSRPRKPARHPPARKRRP